MFMLISALVAIREVNDEAVENRSASTLPIAVW
jgi:hypothetical protein